MEAGGDWVCGDAACGNVNFARRAACNRCGRRRSATDGAAGALALPAAPPAPGCPEIGKSAADKSRGLFAADDWQCGKCANVNWARRTTCNVCSAPKFAEVEARTGYGGGYNERGIVEYRPRHDSDDDDYDEFGRVKKRKRRDSTNRSKVCGNRRHLGSPSDASATPPPPHAPRLSGRPTPEAGRRNSSDFYASLANSAKRNAARSPRKERRRSSTLSVERPIEIRDSDEDERAAPAARRSGPPGRALDPIRRYVGRDFSDEAKNYPELQRNCIMENRVTSTNRVKYKFKGKTAEEDFEVDYSLEERIRVACWAVVYNNCKRSADEFQSRYDKPAPDFKTIFAWRQRLLGGCLIDGHSAVETSGRDTSDCRLRRRKRRRYFRNYPETVDDSSDEPDDYRNAPPRSVGKDTPEKASGFDSDANREPSGTRDCEDKSVGDSSCDNKRSFNENNNTNGSVCRSSTSGAKRSVVDDGKRSDCYMTDNARSETPEMTTARMELARMKSPVRTVTPEPRFHEDNYFEDDPKTVKEADANDSFRIPEIPKQFAKGVEDVSKSMLEDIISESERYSSGDGGDFESDFDNNYNFKRRRENKNKNENLSHRSPPKKSNSRTDEKSAYNLKSLIGASPKKVNNVQSEENETYNPKSFVNSKKIEFVDLPLPKFGNFTEKSIPVDVPNQMNGDETEPSCGKNFTSAMRRIIESMTNQIEQRSAVNIEYVPTKINPAMAIRNHQLFESNLMVESIHDIWPENNNSTETNPIENFQILNSIAEKESVKSTRPTFDDYTPDDDILYRDEPMDFQFGEEPAKIPPETPKIDPVPEKPATKDPIVDTSKMNSLLSLNLSGINTDELALVLKQIQSLKTGSDSTNANVSLNNSITKDKDKNESHKILSTNSSPKHAKKINKIPFFDDIFYSGSPSNAAKDNTNEFIVNSEKKDNADLILDDSIECSLRKMNETAIIGGFKSFAIPKPIMLNRLRNLNQQQTKEQEVNEDKTNNLKKNRIRKKKKSTEDNGHNVEDKNRTENKNNEDDEEESGDEADLSKYDLWGSEDDNEKKDEATTDKDKSGMKSPEKDSSSKSDINQKREPSKSPNESKRRYSDRSPSASSRRSSSSSSSTTSSASKLPRNKYDDFILNSEHSRAGSRDSSSAKSRSPVYDRGREKRPSRSRDKLKDRSRENRDRDRHMKPRDNRDVNKSRDKNRERDRDRQRHHYGGAHSNHGGYIRGRAR